MLNMKLVRHPMKNRFRQITTLALLMLVLCLPGCVMLDSFFSFVGFGGGSMVDRRQRSEVTSSLPIFLFSARSSCGAISVSCCAQGALVTATMSWPSRKC